MIRKFGKWEPVIHPQAIIDDTAKIIGNVKIGKAIIFPDVLIRADEKEVVIEDDVAILDRAFIEGHERVIIGRGSIISHGAIIHGSNIGRNVLVGIGAIVMEVSVGDNAIIASSSLVREDVEPHALVGGIPAKKIRDVGKNDIDYINKIREDIKRKGKWLK